MTKQGYKDNFIKTFTVLTIGLYIAMLYGSQNFTGDALLGQLVFALMYAFIPSVVVAGIWEFFK